MEKKSKGLPEANLEWRRKQPKGAIMKPATFKKIEANAKAGGATNPAAVAGAAYWKSENKKYNASKKK